MFKGKVHHLPPIVPTFEQEKESQNLKTEDD